MVVHLVKLKTMTRVTDVECGDVHIPHNVEISYAIQVVCDLSICFRSRFVLHIYKA